MDKFSYGTYDSSKTGGPFTDSSYVDPTSETDVRKELSCPLIEVKEYINDTQPIKIVSDVEKAIQLKVTDDNLIQYSLDGETFTDTATGGHQIYDGDGNVKPQRTKLMFQNTEVTDSNGYTVVTGIQGAQGVSVSSMVQVEESSTSGGSNKWRATLSNGTTYDFIVKNGAKGDTGDKGDQGNGLVILGTYASLEDLQTAHPTGNEGDIYSVGTSSEANPNYVWDVDDQAWESIGKTRGEKGAKGDTGDTGATGNGIQSIVVTESSVSGGNNLVTITMTGGQVYTFNVKNGEQGSAGTGVPTGGTTGQVMAKRTAVDYDFQYIDLPTVDQTYSSSSTNAQSGVAVASAISTKQDTLVSGTNIKTINGTSLLGSGNLSVQESLVSGTNIKTINNTSILGSGNLSVASRTTYSNISVSVTPSALSSYCAWDTEQKYGYKADVTISGLTTSSMIENLIMSDTIYNVVAPICTTSSNTLTFYTTDATALSGTIITLITSEV